MDKVPAVSLASSDAFLKRHPFLCLKFESQTEMSSLRTIKAMSTRLFLETETPGQKSDRNFTTQQPPDGHPLRACQDKAEPQQKNAQSRVWSELPGR